MHYVTFHETTVPWKAISISQSFVCVCVRARAQACACARVDLFIQYAERRRHIVCVLSRSTISHKRQDFRKKKFTEHKMCFDFSATFI